MTTLEKFVNRSVQESIRKTLIPYLGIDNFEVSVASKLNTDRKQTNETTYDPESRAERSVRTVREIEKSQNAAGRRRRRSSRTCPTTARANGGTQSAEEKNKREDVTNYEMSTKTVTTVSRRLQCQQAVDCRADQPAPPGRRLGRRCDCDADGNRIQGRGNRTDRRHGRRYRQAARRSIRVSAVEFMENGRDIEPIRRWACRKSWRGSSATSSMRAAILLMAVLLIWFGLRPAINFHPGGPRGRARRRSAEVGVRGSGGRAVRRRAAGRSD